ncbi:hypothetical protein [Bradyrhizobium sp. 192]|uniref:hypothetical protein n=1 Tax=Bradyrhizobium sp. 192 TaxID=2782660 RepID=UPI002000474E|nr:hypothetical protein [Bradyrhizobium sp. 192]
MVRIIALLISIICFGSAKAGQIEYPQVIHTQYEAVDQKTGGHFVLWSEREKIFYGLDQQLFPGARSVNITQVTPSDRLDHADLCRDPDGRQQHLGLPLSGRECPLSRQRNDAQVQQLSSGGGMIPSGP